jgi:predicted DNA-binding transcriptional regulator YafY
MDALLTGVIRRWKLQCRYRPNKGRAKDGILAPYALVMYKNGLYVIGKRDDSDPNKPPHVYAAERFVEAEHIRGSTFELPSDFNVDSFFAGAFGIHHGKSSYDVVIEFSAEAKNLIKSRIWHEQQKITSIDGNRLRLSFQVPDITQVISWVLSWGPMAKVIQPQELKTKVEEELAQTIKMYSP